MGEFSAPRLEAAMLPVNRSFFDVYEDRFGTDPLKDIAKQLGD
jgi:hypothetical protein